MRTSLIGLLMSVWLTSAAVVAAQGFNDPTAWTPLVKGLGPTVELSPTHAVLTFPSTSQATTEVSFVAGVQTTCQISGDFDVSVDYDLLTWPLLNGVRTGLWAVDLVYAGRISFSTRDGGWGESYYSNLPGGPFPIPTTDLQGTLRLARSGDIMTAFYLEPIRKVLNPVYLILPVLERREPRCRMSPLE